LNTEPMGEGMSKPKKYSNEWHQEQDFMALSRLYIRGLVTESEKEKINLRLGKKWAEERTKP
jgi:hypothetical protein